MQYIICLKYSKIQYILNIFNILLLEYIKLKTFIIIKDISIAPYLTTPPYTYSYVYLMSIPLPTDYASVYAYVYLSTPTDIIHFINSNLMYYGKGRQRKLKISKQYLFSPVKSKCITEKVSEASQKFSSNFCFTYLIKSSCILVQRSKQDQKFQKVIILFSQV